MPSQIQVQPKGIQSPCDAGTEDNLLKSQLQFMADCRDTLLSKGDRKWKFSCPESLVLHYGRFWTPQPKPKDVRWGRQKQCFSNAYDLAYCRPDLTYCEGFALDSDSARWRSAMRGVLTATAMSSTTPGGRQGGHTWAYR